jgi:hypothetical protein
MKSTLDLPNQKPELFLDTKPSAHLAKTVNEESEKAPPAAVAETAAQKRRSRLLDAFYYWILSRS